MKDTGSSSRVVDKFQGRPIRDAISRIRFSPNDDDDLLLISSWDSVLRLYDVSNDVLRLEANGGGAPLLDCCFQNDRHSSHAFAASSDSTVRRYDLCSGVQSTVGKHDDIATCVEYSDKPGQLISAGLDKKLIFWDLRMMTGYPQMVDSEVVSLSLCGINLVVADGRHVKMYDMRNLKEPLQRTESSMDCQIRCVQAFPDCQGYMAGSVDGRVALKFFDPSKDRDMGCVFRCHPKGKDGKYYMVGVNDIGFHPCLDTFVTGDHEGHAIVWDAQSKKRIFEFPRYPNSVASLSYNYSGHLLAVASSNTYQEAEEVENSCQIFIHEIQNLVCPVSSE